jgi:hypothetical protein
VAVPTAASTGPAPELVGVAVEVGVGDGPGVGVSVAVAPGMAVLVGVGVSDGSGVGVWRVTGASSQSLASLPLVSLAPTHAALVIPPLALSEAV